MSDAGSGTHARQAYTRAYALSTYPSMHHHHPVTSRHRHAHLRAQCVLGLCPWTSGTVFGPAGTGLDGQGNRTRDEVRTAGGQSPLRGHPSVDALKYDAPGRWSTPFGEQEPLGPREQELEKRRLPLD